MSRRRFLIAKLAGAGIIILVFAFTANRAAAADQRLLLEIVINGYSTGKIGEFVLRDDSLLARRQELTKLGLRVPEDMPQTPDGLIAVTSLPGVASRLDKASQTLYVSAGADRLLPALLQPRGGAGGRVESGTGATLDYDLVGNLAAHQNNASGLLDLRIFSPLGVVSSNALVYAGANPADSGPYSAIRLDSTYVYSDSETQRRYRVGDFITGGLAWSRPVRLGGVQASYDFSMRPDLVTFPLPLIGGSAAVPSTVDVLVNGTQIFSHQVEPGPFEVRQLPVLTGASTVAVTVTNALGQQVTTTLPFYASANLLAPGLQTYSIEAGYVRRNWGVVSDDYGKLAGSATYRRGLSSAVTFEAHAEGTTDQFMGGAGFVANAFNMAALNFDAAVSTGTAHAGLELSVGARRIGRVFSFGLFATLANHAFRDIAAMNGDPVPTRQITANLSRSFGRWGSFGIAYTGIDRDAAPARMSLSPPGTFLTASIARQHAHVVTANYSVQMDNVFFDVSGFHDFAGSGSGVLFGVTIPLGARSSVSANLNSGSGTSVQVQAQQSAVTIGDWGYQAYANVDHSNHEFGQVQYKSPWALVSAGIDYFDDRTTLRGEAQGALSFADGGLFASNTINDSFAVVDTDGVGGIDVLYENRLAGKTDSAGRLLVPDLRSFEPNHLSIDPTDVPADVTVSYTTRDVRPQDRSGVVVEFPMHVGRAALLVLVDKNGKPIPVGSTATLQATGTVLAVGYDGEAFADDLAGQNRLAVQLPNGRRCTVAFEYRRVPGEIPKIGPLTCQDENP